MKPSNEDDFKKKREQFSTNVRKVNRQSIIMKRRNFDFYDEPTIVGEKKVKKQNFVILDESMRTYLTEIMKRNYTEDDLTELIQLCHSKDIIDKHRAAFGLRLLTLDESTGTKTAELLLFKKSLDEIVSWYTQEEYLQLKFESLWLITNLISHSTEACQHFIEKSNILTNICNDLMNKYDNIKLRAIWAVGNIAAESTKYRDLLIEQGSIIKIIHYLEAERSNQQITTSIWALSNLSRGKPLPKYEPVKHVIPSIAEAIKQNLIKSQTILSDCLWTLANLSEGAKPRLQRILETNVIPSVMKYLRNPNLKLSVPALRIIGNFTTGNKQHTNEVLKNKFFDEALILLGHEKGFIVKQTCWALSNIAAGTDQQILQFLQRNDIIHKLIEIYPSQTNQIKSQIIWIFSNLERSDIPEMIQKFMQELGLIKMIGEMLKCGDDKCILDALLCLNRILVMADRCVENSDENNKLAQEFIAQGLIPTLENVYHHPSPNIQRESKKILDRFFSNEEKQCERMRDD